MTFVFYCCGNQCNHCSGWVQFNLVVGVFRGFIRPSLLGAGFQRHQQLLQAYNDGR